MIEEWNEKELVNAINHGRENIYFFKKVNELIREIKRIDGVLDGVVRNIAFNEPLKTTQEKKNYSDIVKKHISDFLNSPGARDAEKAFNENFKNIFKEEELKMAMFVKGYIVAGLKNNSKKLEFQLREEAKIAYEDMILKST
jgi:hypothetical protein